MTQERIQTSKTPPQWLYWLTLLLIFVIPGQISYAIDKKHGPFIGLADVVAVLIIGLWFLWVLVRGQLRHLVWAPRSVWALLVVALLSAAGAASLKAAAMEIIQLVLYFVAAYMLFVSVLVTAQRQRMALRVFLAATSLVVLFGLYQYLTQTDPLAVTSVFASRTAYAAFLTITLPLFFGFVLWAPVQGERYWALAVVLLGALTVLAPPLVWILALVLVVMAARRGPRASVAYVLAGLVVFLAVTVTVAPLNRRAFREMLNPYEEGPLFKVAEVTAPGEQPGTEKQQPIVKKRWIEWMPALNMMAENYMLGIGTGNYQLNIGQPEYYGFLPNVKKSEPDTNNLYLVVGSTMGFAGLVCLAVFMGHFLQAARHLWSRAQTPWTRAMCCGLYGSALAIPAANMFTSVFVRGTGLVWALLYALIACNTAARAAEQHETSDNKSMSN